MEGVRKNAVCEIVLLITIDAMSLMAVLLVVVLIAVASRWGRSPDLLVLLVAAIAMALSCYSMARVAIANRVRRRLAMLAAADGRCPECYHSMPPTGAVCNECGCDLQTHRQAMIDLHL